MCVFAACDYFKTSSHFGCSCVVEMEASVGSLMKLTSLAFKNRFIALRSLSEILILLFMCKPVCHSNYIIRYII